jgi:HAD superfamily hydrolase (TIGR01662 family)
VTPTDDGISAIFFDIGETLFDRTREYAAWARWLAVPPHTFSAVFGAVVARGGTVLDVLQHFRPGADYTLTRSLVQRDVGIPALGEADLYPGARAALEQLHQAGFYLAVAGNQPREIGAELRDLALPVDLVAVSAELGVAKPAPGFFTSLLERAGCAPAETLYVGDQLDNDVLAAHAVDLRTVRVLTGPWGQLLRDDAVEARCLAVLDSVAALPAWLRR